MFLAVLSFSTSLSSYLTPKTKQNKKNPPFHSIPSNPNRYSSDCPHRIRSLFHPTIKSTPSILPSTMKQSCSFESFPSTDTDIIRSMAAFPSKTPSSFDLLQNCDLPTPLKVFPGLNPTAKLYGLMGDHEDEDGGVCGGDDDRMGLLKALQLSQTRAREAEKRIEGFAKERECLSDAVLRESLQGLAYRNWVRVLECQVSVLKLKVKEREEDEREVAAAVVTAGWVFSWAIPLGIAGIGFAFAFRFFF